MDANRDRLERKILHGAGRAIAEYAMIGAGDHVAAALSGGKDSFVLLHALSVLQKKSPVPWRLSALAIDLGDPDFPAAEIAAIAARYELPCVVERTTILADVARMSHGKNFCGLCSRFRRGALLRVARRIGANRLALGHTRDDVLETLLINLFFTGRFMAMAPVLPSAGGAVTVIRPLTLVPGATASAFAAARGFPRHGCSLGEDTRRRWARALLEQLRAANPNVDKSLESSLRNQVASHLLKQRSDR